MIRLITPNQNNNNYTNWIIFIGFSYQQTDPTLNSKTYGTRNTWPSPNTGGLSGNTFSPNFTVNIPSSVSRTNFLNQIESFLNTISSIIGIHTVNSKTELFYGTNPINPTEFLYQAEIIGTCNIVIPNRTFFIQEYVLSPSFEIIIPVNNNCCSLIYT